MIRAEESHAVSTGSCNRLLMSILLETNEDSIQTESVTVVLIPLNLEYCSEQLPCIRRTYRCLINHMTQYKTLRTDTSRDKDTHPIPECRSIILNVV